LLRAIETPQKNQPLARIKQTRRERSKVYNQESFCAGGAQPLFSKSGCFLQSASDRANGPARGSDIAGHLQAAMG
jgi:hypothetical protein